MKVFRIDPMGKVRMTRADAWKKRPVVLRWRAFADRCRELGMSVAPGDGLEFTLAMPRSWARAKRASHLGKPHKSKPDLDNLIGAVWDAVCKGGDSHLWCIGACSKVWGIEGSITVISGSTPPAKTLQTE